MPPTTRCASAISDAGLDEVVARLPEGLATMLGTDGAGLSAGERQRVALARAFLRDAPLLLLDEPTANLDGATEESVLSAVRRLMIGRTVVMAAHRPSLLAVSDRVVRLAPPVARWRRRDRRRRRTGRADEVGARWAGRWPSPVRRRAALLARHAPRARRHRRRHRAPRHGGLADLEGGPASQRGHPGRRHRRRPVLRVVPGFFRYEERLVGHDAAFRLLADLRVQGLPAAREVGALGLPSFRRGDLLARVVQDVDSLQDLVLRVLPPFGIALVVGVSTVVLLWWMLPAAGVDPGRGPGPGGHRRAVAHRAAGPAPRGAVRRRAR